MVTPNIYQSVIQYDFSNLLSAASLFDGDFSIDWLIQLTELKASAVLGILETASNKGDLIRKPYGMFCFTIPSIQSKWQQNLTDTQKDSLQRKIADILLNDLPDGEEKAKRIAGHLLDISNDLERCNWLSKAGDIYLKSFNTKASIKCYAKLIKDLADHEGELVDRLYINTAIKFSKIADIQFDVKGILKILKDAYHRAESRDDARSLALLNMHIAKNEWYRSHYSEAIKRFNKGWAAAQKIDDPDLMRSAVTFSTFFHYWQGYFQEAITIYENSVAEMDKTPQGRFPLMAASTMGYCYTLTGQIAQGLGMLDTARSDSADQGENFLSTFSKVVTAIALLNMQHIDEAIGYIEVSYQNACKWPDSPLMVFCSLLLAYAYFLRGKKKKSIQHLNAFLTQRELLQVSMWPYPYLIELCWAIEKNELPAVSGLSLQKEIQNALSSKNVFLIGIAYRFKSFLQQKKGAEKSTIQRSLKSSEKWLKKSGQKVELARTLLTLANHHFAEDHKKEGKSAMNQAKKTLSTIKLSMMPVDLKPLFKDRKDGHNLAENLLVIGEMIQEKGNKKLLIFQLITTANRILGAERGAIFLSQESSEGSTLNLLSSRNLNAKQIADKGFESAKAVIKKAMKTGTGTILNPVHSTTGLSNESIRSLICAPIKMGDSILGVMYHDNRLLQNAFEEQDLELLSRYAALTGLAVENQSLQQELKSVQSDTLEDDTSLQTATIFPGIIGKSPAIRKVYSQMEQVASTDTTVLILGETGVGKELVAKAIHLASDRKKGPFVAINCNALPDTLIAGELFGHEKGAFTGAIQQRPGRFELADKGTLFIDEIGELPLESQVRLLRVIQSREFERVGGITTIQSDFRLIVATNRNIEDEVADGRFRADLFYRLNTFPLFVPPLRHRTEDIPLLALHFLQIYALKIRKKFNRFPDNEMAKLIRYQWPGNVRELEHVIERGTILNQGTVFKVPEISPVVTRTAVSGFNTTMSLEALERQYIQQTLESTRGKIRGSDGAAKRLDIHPSTLYSKMKKLGIQKPLS